MNAVIYFIFGLCLGSFSNVVIYRMPKNESINFPASHCQSCHTPLKWYHNIPLFSWLFLYGKCAFCGEKISIQYPIIELLGGLIALFCYFSEANLISSAFLGLTFIALMDLSLIDIRYKAVPEKLLYASLIFGVLYGFSVGEFEIDGMIDTIIATVFYAFLFWLLRFVVSKAMKTEAMGSADIYIAALIGAVLGLKLGAVAIYIAAILTLPVYLIIRKKNYELAFVPFLSAGLVLTYAFKTQILELLGYLYG
ncbi:MAG: prepilin peptidase [Campylobacter sp.]|nr:prepilin peptidase [Campylobacter sp.]